jgi:hypothetical protein
MTTAYQRAQPRKTSLRPRSRAAVVWALATLLGLQVAFHYPCCQWWPDLYDVEYGPKVRRLRGKLRDRSGDRPLVVALGSSLTGMGVRPGELAADPANGKKGPIIFNCGSKGGLVLVEAVYLRRLLAEGIRPDLVLVETYPPFFLAIPQNDPRQVQGLDTHRLMRQDLELVTRFLGNGDEVRKEWREAQCVPWYFHRNVLMNWYMLSWVPAASQLGYDKWELDEWGWETCPSYFEQMKSYYRTERFLNDMAMQQDSWNRWEFNEDRTSLLREMLTSCHEARIEVALLWPPESSFYRAIYSPALMDRCERWFERLKDEFSVSLINARAWVDDAKFAEGLHLRPEGAVDYTRQLDRELRRRRS